MYVHIIVYKHGSLFCLTQKSVNTIQFSVQEMPIFSKQCRNYLKWNYLGCGSVCLYYSIPCLSFWWSRNNFLFIRIKYPHSPNLGYLIHILALNMPNIWSRCFKSMPWPDVNSKKTSPDIRKCQINWICKYNKNFCHSKIWLHSTPILHSMTPLQDSTP